MSSSLIAKLSLFFFFEGNIETATKYSYRSGLHIMIHNQSTLPLAINNGMRISPAFESYIGIKRTFTNRLDQPYSNCLKSLKPFSNYSSVLFKYFDDLNIATYTQELCLRLCYQDKLIDLCGCCDLNTPSIRNVSYCASDQQLFCQNGFKYKFETSDVGQLCSYSCPTECNSISYDSSVDTAYFPTLTYLRSLSVLSNLPSLFPKDQSLLADFARQGYLKVIINYDDISYTSLDDNPQYTIQDLLGNIGGQLGLFIGISFLSFIEFLQLFVEIVLITYSNYIKPDLKSS